MKKRDTTTGTTWQYDAFISYRHTDPDSFVAETLHKQLENFKLPASVVKQKKAQMQKQAEKASADAAGLSKYSTVKTRIHRVFRDREELPLVANLADPITDALEHSEYLIVICSPRLNESMWCRKEIETFIAMHDRDHVLAVLAEGEPDTSFPEELLYREEEEIQPDGSVIKRKIPVEPLAADVRGADHKEIKKKIKSELLRLAAPMFDCNYDELRQRHKEQRTHKIIMTSVSVSAVCLLFGLVSTTMALRIRHQNTQIKEQAVEIAAQADEIEAQYQEAKRSSCISRSKEGLTYLEQGDRMQAIATVQDAIWDLADRGDVIYDENPIKEDVSYPAQAVYALSESLYLYENGQQMLPDRLLKADSAIQYMKLSPEGSRIVTLDASGRLTVWNPENTAAQIRIAVDAYHNGYEAQVAFYGEDRLFAPGEDEVILYDVSGETAEILYRIPCEDYVGVLVRQEKGQAVLLREEGFAVIDCEDGSRLCEAAWDQGELIARATAKSVLSEDERYFAVALSNSYYSDAEERRVAVYDAASGEPIGSYEIDYEYIQSLRFDGDRIYVVSDHSGDYNIERVTLGMEGRLQAFDLSAGTAPVWTYEQHNGWLYETSYAHKEDSDYLICSGYGEVVVLNKQDGSYIDMFSFGTEVVRIAGYVGSDDFLAFTRDGVWHYLSMKRMEDMVGTVFPKCTSANVKDFAIGDGYCVTLPYNSREMTVYKVAQGVGLETFYESEYSYKDAALSKNGRYLAVSFYNDGYTTAVDGFDTQTGEKLWTYEEADTYYQGMLFGEYDAGEALVIVTDEAILMLDPASGELLAGQETGISSCEYLGSDEAGQFLFLRDYTTLYCYDVQAAEYAYTMAPEGFSANDAAAFAHNMAFYAVADQESETLRFYEMGETEPFLEYDESQNSEKINFAYIETMFFGAQDRHLYIVYKDGRIAVMGIDPDSYQDNPDVYFCTWMDSPDQYDALEDIMRSCTVIPDSAYAVMQGSSDAYLVQAGDGALLAHLHGFLACDGAAGQFYLRNGGSIYRIPIYTLEEMDRFAGEVRESDSGTGFYFRGQ